MNTDIYAKVTDQIISLLEKGTAPWRSPYLVTNGLPRNFSSGNYYQGINVFLLGCLNFPSPWFLTFLQAKELGGHVKKGETGHLVIKCGSYQKETENSLPGGDATETRRFLKGYTVFNACQIEGIEFPEAKHPERTTTEIIESVEAIVRNMPNPPVIHEGRKGFPCYLKSSDTVEMPTRSSFRSDPEFFQCVYHELCHASGHLSRLARRTLVDNQGISATGEARKVYSEEELVAEMGAAYLSAITGIVTDGHDNSAAYLQGWLSVLKVSDHKTWIVRAASEAQKAAAYILGASPSE